MTVEAEAVLCEPVPTGPYRFLAVLDTMWGGRPGIAPAHFCISEYNFSGRRLYAMTGEEPGCLWCTNACRELVSGPSHHGTPDPAWLLQNLEKWLGIMNRKRACFPAAGEPCVLLCGNVAWSCWEAMPCWGWGRKGVAGLGRVVSMPHPAARTWTAPALARAGRLVREGRHDLRMRLGAGGRLAVHLLEGCHATRGM